MTEVLNRAALNKQIKDRSLARFVIGEANQSQNPVKTLRLYTGMNNAEVNTVIFKSDRDINLPILMKALQTIIPQNTDDLGLPRNITLKELKRATGFSFEQIISLINKFRPLLAVGKKKFEVSATKPTLLEGRYLQPRQIKEYKLNPKRILRRSRYLSRPRGGGPAQRIRLQGKKIREIVKNEVYSSSKLTFLPIETLRSNKTTSNSKKLNQTPTESLWQVFSTKGVLPENIPNIIKAYKSLEQMEFFKSAFNQEALINILIRLANGESVPIPIFNCLSLSWDKKGKKYPSVTISSDDIISIARFNRKNIRLVQNILYTIGNPEFYIVIPDSEIFDERVWAFSQSAEERTQIAINLRISMQIAFPNIPIIYWSDYCKKYQLKNPNTYTEENYLRIKSNPALMTIVMKSLNDTRAYLAGYIGEKSAFEISQEELLEKTLWYFAMYAGEGQALADSQGLSLNFEEGNVPKWFQIGACEKLAIISPSKNIYEFYQWKRRRQMLLKTSTESAPPWESSTILGLQKLSLQPAEYMEKVPAVLEQVSSMNPLILYVPWGYRKTSTFGGKEIDAMDYIDQVVNFISSRGINVEVLLLTTTPYWCEINGYPPDDVKAYFADVSAEANSRGYNAVDWDRIRYDNLDLYLKLQEYWRRDKIKSVIPPNLLEKSRKSAKKISQKAAELGDEEAAFIYNRERIIEAQLIQMIFSAIKLSMAPRGGINDFLDYQLPRIYPLPDELNYPWWPERRIVQ